MRTTSHCALLDTDLLRTDWLQTPRTMPRLRRPCNVNVTIRYEMLFNVRSKADASQLNLPHGTDN